MRSHKVLLQVLVFGGHLRRTIHPNYKLAQAKKSGWKDFLIEKYLKVIQNTLLLDILTNKTGFLLFLIKHM